VLFRFDRRWATLAVAVVLGASGGTLLGFVTAPAPGEDLEALVPVPEVASSTTLRQRSRVAGTSSTTIRPRPRVLPAATAGRSPVSSTARPTTTPDAPTTSTTVAPSTTTSTTVGGTTTSSSSTVPSSTTTSTS
jgi:hypothetical protein